MRALIIALASFVLVALSCAPPAVIDAGYVGSDHGLTSAKIAAEAWNQTCGLELVRVHRGGGDFVIEERDGIFRNAYAETTLERPFLGFAGRKRVTAMWFLSGAYAVSELAHEFGHALGLDHAPTGVMKPGGELEVLDPATHWQTLRPDAITAEDCARAVAR